MERHRAVPAAPYPAMPRTDTCVRKPGLRGFGGFPRYRSSLLPLAAARSPAHRTTSARSRSSDLNSLHAVMSADIPHAQDTDGSSQMRPSPPRNGRAMNRAK
ncbi:Hypothetical predicted protein [Marmota monax]|uniref:Uncharacterized protein n=1 Tax=Marmota monax TaxID=9995 RepID=A0A5E4AT93_MARMO|nr:Hypothetical predicted protein [Marmota monax]